VQAAGTDPNSLEAGNWDQLTTLAGKLLKKNGSQIQRWGFNHKIQDGWLWLWGLANGGKFISDDLKKASYNDPKVVEALDWGVKDFDAQGGYQAFQAFSTSSPVWTANEEFARDLVSMTVYENWMLGIIAQAVPDRNFVVLPVLMRNGGSNDWVGFSTGQAWCMTSGVKNADAAWEFIKFMCEESTWLIGANGTKDYQKKNNKPYIPTLTSDKIADQLQIQQVYEPIAPKFDNAIKLFAALQDKSVPMPVSRSPVSTQLQDDLNNLGAKPALNHESSAQDALNRANQKAQQDIDSFRP
jgi:ABC-type glycerol-3-phosphate transport system substrate-binding protein